MEQKSNRVEAIVIDDVKDINELVIKGDEVLIQVELKNDTGLIIPDHLKESSITKVKWSVIKIGKAVKDYEVGDLIIDFNENGALFLNYNKVGYIVVNSYSIRLATKAGNLEF